VTTLPLEVRKGERTDWPAVKVRDWVISGNSWVLWIATPYRKEKVVSILHYPL
jgi:hypothetical protein